MLDDRKSLVLQALVEEYIRTGEPVSSQAIVKRGGLDVSSATVRNDLVSLEGYGFVSQPHTSSGRVPTSHGYRYYVDHCSPTRLRSATRARIESFFAEVHLELARLLKDTSGLLTDLTHFPAVVIGPGTERDAVHSVNLVRLGGPMVLVVTVADTGRVSQELLSLGFEPTDRQLDEAEQLIEAVYAGRALADARDDERITAGDLPEVVRRIVEPVHTQLQAEDDDTGEVYVGGTSELAGLWSDLAIVQQMLGVLEAEGELRQMIEDVGEGTSVRIGAELGADVDMAVVASSFGDGARALGRIAVIGPMRMDYPRTIRVVEEVGEGLADSLGGDG